MFSNLYELFQSTVKFGDISKIDVIRGSIIFLVTKNIIHMIYDVLFVPNLKTNLISNFKRRDMRF